MGAVVSSLCQLVLEIPSKFAPDIINKGLKVSKVFLENGFELWPRDWNGVFVVTFVLGPFEADGAAKEDSGKRGTIHLCSA